MAWTALTFAFGSVLTSTKMTQLQANLAAMASGDAGAPEVLNAALKTGIGGLTGSVADTLRLPVAMDGYSFFPNIHGDSVLGFFMEAHGTDGGGADSPRFALANDTGVTVNYDIDWRYVDN